MQEKQQKTRKKDQKEIKKLALKTSELKSTLPRKSVKEEVAIAPETVEAMTKTMYEGKAQMREINKTISDIELLNENIMEDL